MRAYMIMCQYRIECKINCALNTNRTSGSQMTKFFTCGRRGLGDINKSATLSRTCGSCRDMFSDHLHSEGEQLMLQGVPCA